MNDKKIIICDLDGTIANVQHRLHYIKNPDGTMKPYAERDWNSFNAACGDDEPYMDNIEILQSLVLGMGDGCNVCGAIEREFYFFSGRNESVRSETIEWLQRHVPITEDRDWELYMRSENDFRPDTTVKYEMMYELKIMPEDVLCILDDRQSVVDMWRENGFRVMQVDAWKEPPSRHSLVTPTGKGTSPMMEPIPMLDTPDFDLGDVQENNSCSDK
jgi:3-deoxy-D-manno-octulosonate 8-phosphate phosphatase KdsC-like HAD superfamily phosphatase